MTPEANSTYISDFKPSIIAEEVLRNGKIISLQETPQNMIERMVTTLFSVEGKFGTPSSEIQKMTNQFGAFLDDKKCVMSTPVMTNAGRYENRPLSACTVPPIDLRGNLSQVENVINHFHSDGMGTGFSLNEVDEPVRVLQFLNNVAVQGANGGNEDRPVGNMAILSAHHPQILNFVFAKTDADQKGEEWKFNISVDASAEFMDAVIQKTPYVLWDGTRLNAAEVMESIARSAHLCGDPGLIFMDRMNKDNPTPGLAPYASTAPCAEVGLAPGESCQFGYVNVGEFVSGDDDISINYSELELVTRLMTRVLDNALEISIDRYFHPTSQHIMRAKRKIGVGICGLADMFIKMGIPYDSDQARQSALDIVSFINYVSKLESHELAKTRGSFEAMILPIGNRYNDEPGFLEQKYGRLETLHVTPDMWQGLGKLIRETGLLRNASTIALPPTGRSGLVIDASTGIEPVFTLANINGEINPLLYSDLKERGLLNQEVLDQINRSGRIGHIESIPLALRNIYATALEIAPAGHLEMGVVIQHAVDESISKTINIPESSTPMDITNIYMNAYKKGLKGITVFRANSKTYQPRKLAEL